MNVLPATFRVKVGYYLKDPSAQINLKPLTLWQCKAGPTVKQWRHLI